MQQPVQPPTPQRAVQPPVNPLPITSNGQKKEVPSSQGTSPSQTPRQPQPNSNKGDEFANFFGTGNQVQTGTTVQAAQNKPVVQPPITANNPPPKQQPLAGNQGAPKADFTNFFGTGPNQGASKLVQPPPPPQQPQPE